MVLSAKAQDERWRHNLAEQQIEQKRTHDKCASVVSVHTVQDILVPEWAITSWQALHMRSYVSHLKLPVRAYPTWHLIVKGTRQKGAIFSLWYHLSGSLLAGYWSKNIGRDK
jgi:hypothetical protein